MSLVVHEAEPFEPGARRARGRAGASADRSRRAARAANRRRRVRRRAGRRAQGACSATSPARTRCCSRCARARASGGCASAPTTGSTPSPALRAELDQLLGPRLRLAALSRLDFLRGNRAAIGNAGERVPALPHLLRQADRAARLHRDALPLPLQLRGSAHRRPLHGLHAQGLPGRDRRRHVRARRGRRRLRRDQDDRRPAAPVPVPGRARLRGRRRRRTRCVNPRFFDCTDEGPEGIRAFDLRDASRLAPRSPSRSDATAAATPRTLATASGRARRPRSGVALLAEAVADAADRLERRRPSLRRR